MAPSPADEAADEEIGRLVLARGVARERKEWAQADAKRLELSNR